MGQERARDQRHHLAGRIARSAARCAREVLAKGHLSGGAAFSEQHEPERRNGRVQDQSIGTLSLRTLKRDQKVSIQWYWPQFGITNLDDQEFRVNMFNATGLINVVNLTSSSELALQLIIFSKDSLPNHPLISFNYKFLLKLESIELNFVSFSCFSISFTRFFARPFAGTS